MCQPAILKHTRSFVLALGLVFTSATCADCSEPKSTTLHRLQKEALSKLQLGDARLSRSQYRLAAIEQLFQQGHASFKELTEAKIEHADLVAQQGAAKEMVCFLDAMVNASDQARQVPYESSSRPRVTLVMDSLASDPKTKLISTLTLNLAEVDAEDAWINKQLESIQAMNELRVRLCAQKYQTRQIAWTQLLEKLGSINDGSESIKNEISLAKLERRHTAAEKEFAQHLDEAFALQHEVVGFSFEDRTISTEEEILAMVHSKAARVQAVAIAESSLKKQVLLAEFSSRLEDAAADNASPWNERSAIQNRIADLDLQHHLAENLLTESELANHPDNSDQYTFVSQATIDVGSPHAFNRMSLLRNALDATTDRLLDAAEQADVAQYRRDQLGDKATRVETLSVQDSFFAREAEVVRLRADLARAESKHAEHQHHLRMLENRFADAVVLAYEAIAIGGTDDRLSWQVPLREWFKLKAESKASQEMASKQFELDHWLLCGTEQLYETGDASWKELIAARVRCEESRCDVLQSATRQKRDLMIYQILNQAVDLPVTLPATTE